MKKTIVFFAAIAVVFLIHSGCNKRSDLLRDTTESLFAYSGDDTAMLRLSKEVLEKGILVSDSFSIRNTKVTWDEAFIFKQLGDSECKLIVPLIGADSVANNYLCAALNKESGKVQNAYVFNYDKDYKSSVDSIGKMQRGGEWKTMAKRGLKIPSSFSLEAYEKALKLYKKQVANSWKNGMRGTSDPVCTANLYMVFSYYAIGECKAAIEHLEATFKTSVEAELNALAQSIDRSRVKVTVIAGGLVIECTPMMIGYVETTARGVFANTFGSFNSAHCAFNVQELEVDYDCRDDDGGDNGGGDTPPEEPKDPCSDISAEASLAIVEQAYASFLPQETDAYIGNDMEMTAYGDGEKLIQHCGPTWDFFKCEYFPGSYSQYTAFFNAIRVRDNNKSNWRWASFEFGEAKETFNNVIACWKTEVEVNQKVINIGTEKPHIARVELKWTCQTITSILGQEIRHPKSNFDSRLGFWATDPKFDVKE